jgi:hypothetical protein
MPGRAQFRPRGHPLSASGIDTRLTLPDVLQRRMLHAIAIALLVVIAYALLVNTVTVMRGGLGI